MSQQLGTPTLPSSRQALGLVSFHPAAGVGHHEESGAVPCLLTSQPLEQCDGSRVLGHLRARATRAHNQSAVTIATVAAFFSISCVLLHSTLVDRSAPPGSQTWFLEHKGHKAPTSVPCMPCCPIQKSSTQLRNIRPFTAQRNSWRSQAFECHAGATAMQSDADCAIFCTTCSQSVQGGLSHIVYSLGHWTSKAFW